MLNNHDIITGTDEDILVHGKGLDAIRDAIKKKSDSDNKHTSKYSTGEKSAGGDLSEKQAATKLGEMGSNGHSKYLKKYKSGTGKWVYVYDDGDTKVKRIGTGDKLSKAEQGKVYKDISNVAKKSNDHMTLFSKRSITAKASGSRTGGVDNISQKGGIKKSGELIGKSAKKAIKKTWNGSLNSISDIAKSMKVK